MAKKKKAQDTISEKEGRGSEPTSTKIPSREITSPAPSNGPTLVICRNKHWRYISSYHGSWLNLPLEVLESLAYSNFYSPGPAPIDPAVFFDLVKIRTLIDNATDLVVRAANGTTAASLSNGFSSSNGYLNSTDAEILGIGTGRGGGNAKLSGERKFRMRQHASSKLARAYALDEIATSVATMQATSALDDVAKHVLQRNESDTDAMYVHFFHEKIPSRLMAEYTSLKSLSDIIALKHTDPALYRTRAVTRIFKEDYTGAIRDITEGLSIHKLYHADCSTEKRELVPVRDAVKHFTGKIDEKDHPKSIEPQFLFHRGGVYLTLACQNIATAIEGLQHAKRDGLTSDAAPLPQSPHKKEEARGRIEARKLVRTYAKRALRDYTAFLSHLDYTPGLSTEFTEIFLDRVAEMTGDRGGSSRSEQLPDTGFHSTNGLSDALTKYERKGRADTQLPPIPKAVIYKASDLFNAVLPADLPPYPSDEATARSREHPIFSLPDFSEAITYHPLLTDVLHSILLCHCLVQTSTKELLRHAYNAARLARVCDGSPIFLAARSPARADWVEVLLKTKNWLGLERSWEDLCTPVERSSHNTRLGAPQKIVSIEREKIGRYPSQEARAIAVEDERMSKQYNNISPPVLLPVSDTSKSKPSAKKPASKIPEILREQPTERAEAIAQWILLAPSPGSSKQPADSDTAIISSKSARRRKPAARQDDNTTMNQATQTARLRKQASNVSTGSDVTATATPSGAQSMASSICGLEASTEDLELED